MVNLVAGDSEEFQVSMEMDGNTDVNAINGHVIENHLMRDTLDSSVFQPVQNSMLSQLSPVELYDSRKSGIKEGVLELIKDSIPFEDAMENLFDIQIKEIDVELEKFNENLDRKRELE